MGSLVYSSVRALSRVSSYPEEALCWVRDLVIILPCSRSRSLPPWGSLKCRTSFPMTSIEGTEKTGTWWVTLEWIRPVSVGRTRGKDQAPVKKVVYLLQYRHSHLPWSCPFLRLWQGGITLLAVIPTSRQLRVMSVRYYLTVSSLNIFSL